MSYNVARYYEEPNPKVTIHLNQFAHIIPEVKPAKITATVWDNEGLIYVSNPATDNLDPKVHVAAPFIEIANYALSIEVLPRNYKLDVPAGTGIKVIFGAIKDYDEWRAPLSVPQFTASSTIVKSGFIVAHEKYGAVIIRFKPLHNNPQAWPNAQSVPVKTTLNVSKFGLTLKPLAFIKVEDLWWGSGFEGIDFYNLSGFSFRFERTQLQIAHIQFWTAAKGVNCGVHNHSDAIFQELHVSLSPGTGDGGMARLKDECSPEDPDPAVLNELGMDAFDLLPLQRLEEHGGMWYRDAHGLPIRDPESRVIKYPFHKWQAGCGKAGVDVWAALEFGLDIDYRVEGIGEVEGAKKTVLPAAGIDKCKNKTRTVTHRHTAHRGCC